MFEPGAANSVIWPSGVAPATPLGANRQQHTGQQRAPPDKTGSHAAQHPKHWSGRLPATVVRVSATGNVVKIPPPWTRNDSGASTLFAVTTLSLTVSVGGRSPNDPFQMPPPSALDGSPNGNGPPAPRAFTRLATTSVRSSVRLPPFAMPPPEASAAPCASTETVLRWIWLSRMVTSLSTSIPPPSATASPAETASARLSVS